MVTQKGDNTLCSRNHMVILTMRRQAVKKMFNDRELAAELDAKQDSSSHLQTPSTSDDWFRRSFIMYMLIQDWLDRVK